MKVIVAGCRWFMNYNVVKLAIRNSGFDIDKIITGGATGVDRCAKRFAETYAIPLDTYEAEWKIHGKSAGPIRNAEMAKNANALVAVWDGKSRGTKNMISTAKNAGLKVFIWKIEPLPGD